MKYCCPRVIPSSEGEQEAEEERVNPSSSIFSSVRRQLQSNKHTRRVIQEVPFNNLVLSVGGGGGGGGEGEGGERNRYIPPPSFSRPPRFLRNEERQAMENRSFGDSNINLENNFDRSLYRDNSFENNPMRESSFEGGERRVFRSPQAGVRGAFYLPEPFENFEEGSCGGEHGERGVISPSSPIYNPSFYQRPEMTFQDIKKVLRRFSRVFDPRKDQGGVLLEERQVVVPGAEDEVFNDRYRVLQKMNKLSNFLLSKKAQDSPISENESYNASSPKRFNHRTLNSAEIKRNLTIRRSPECRFKIVSLAMLNSKGPSAEDRPIYRGMRIGKGGVVDLAQEKGKRKKFKVKKVVKKRNLGKSMLRNNPKYREKAAMLIQYWWREIKERYNQQIKKIIKIQSVWRGKWVRKYIYDMIYLNYLYISFCKIIENAIKKHIFYSLLNSPLPSPRQSRYQVQTKTQKTYTKTYDNKSKYSSLLTLEKIFELRKQKFFFYFLRKLLSFLEVNKRTRDSLRGLVAMKREKEKKIRERYFSRWKYIGKIIEIKERNEEVIREKEDEYRKNRHILDIKDEEEKEEVEYKKQPLKIEGFQEFFDREGKPVKEELFGYLKREGEVFDKKGRKVEIDLNKISLTLSSIFDANGNPVKGDLIKHIKTKGDIYDKNGNTIRLNKYSIYEIKNTNRDYYDVKGNPIKGNLIDYIKKYDVYDEYNRKTRVDLEDFGINESEVRDVKGKTIYGDIIKHIKTKGDIYDKKGKPISIDMDEYRKNFTDNKSLNTTDNTFDIYDNKGNKIKGDIVEYIKTKGDIYDIKGKPIKIDIDTRRKNIISLYDQQGNVIKGDLTTYLHSHPSTEVYNRRGEPVEVDLQKFGVSFNDTMEYIKPPKMDVYDEEGKVIKGDLVRYIKTKGDVYDIRGNKIYVFADEYRKARGDLYDQYGKNVSADLAEYVKNDLGIYDAYGKPIKADVEEYIKNNDNIYDKYGKKIQGNLIEVIKNNDNIYDFKGEKIKSNLDNYVKQDNHLYDIKGNEIKNDLEYIIKTNDNLYNSQNQPAENDLETYIKSKGVYDSKGRRIKGSLVNYIRNNNDIYDANNNKIELDFEEYKKNKGDLYTIEGKPAENDLLNYVKNTGDIYDSNNKKITNDLFTYIKNTNGDLYDVKGKPIKGDIAQYVKNKGDLYDKYGKPVNVSVNSFRHSLYDVYDSEMIPVSDNLVTLIKNNYDLYDIQGKPVSGELDEFIRTKGDLFDQGRKPIRTDLEQYIKGGKDIYDLEGKKIKVSGDEFNKRVGNCFDEKGKKISGDLVEYVKNGGDIYDINKKNITKNLVDLVRTKGTVFDEENKPIKQDLVHYIKNNTNVYDYEGRPLKLRLSEFRLRPEAEVVNVQGVPKTGDLLAELRKGEDVFDAYGNPGNKDLETYIRNKGGDEEKVKYMEHVIDRIEVRGTEGKKEDREKDIEMIRYLKELNKKNSLKRLLKIKEISTKNLLRKALYKWLTNTLNMRIEENTDKLEEYDRQIIKVKMTKKQELTEEEKRKIDEIDEKIQKNMENLELIIKLRNMTFKTLIDNINRKKKLNILQKFFKRWFRKCLQMAKKDLNDKTISKEKEIIYSPVSSGREDTFRSDLEAKAKEAELRRLRQENSTIKQQYEDQILELKKKDIENELNRKKNEFNNLSDKNKACILLQRFCWRYTHKDPLDSLLEKQNALKRAEALERILTIRDKAIDNILRKYLRKWKNICKKMRNSELITKMFAKYLSLLVNSHKKRLLSKKLNKWRRNCSVSEPALESYQKARAIFDILDVLRRRAIKDNGKNFLERLGKVRGQYITKKKGKGLYNQYKRKEMDKLRDAFNKWRNNVNKLKANDLKLRTLLPIYGKTHNDNYYKKILDKYFHKWLNKVLLMKLDEMDQPDIPKEKEIVYVKDTELIKTKILGGTIKRMDKSTRMNLLKKFLRLWLDITKNDQENVNKMKDHIVKYNILKNALDYLKKLARNGKDKRIHKLLGKITRKKVKLMKIILLKYLLRWKNKVYALRGKDGDKVFRGKLMKILLNKNDKNILKRAFDKWKNGGKKEKHYSKMPFIVANRLLRRYMIRKPFKQLIRNLRLSDKEALNGKGKKLKHVLFKIPYKNFLDRLRKNVIYAKLEAIFPKLFEKYKLKTLRTYFDKWRKLTNEYKLEKLNRQKEEPKREEPRVERGVDEPELRRKRRNELLKLLVSKLTNNDKCSLILCFKYWYKITMNDLTAKNARIIQEFCKGALYINDRDLFKNGKRFGELILYLLTKMVAKSLKEVNEQYKGPVKDALEKLKNFEKIMAVRNMEKYAKKIRINKILRKLVDELTRKNLLKEYLDRWRRNISQPESVPIPEPEVIIKEVEVVKEVEKEPKIDIEKVIKIQKMIRKFLARKKLRGLRKFNQILLDFYAKKLQNEKDGLASRLRRWAYKAKQIEDDENARIIQDFLRGKVWDKIRKKKLEFFRKLAEKLLKRKILNAGKFNKLKNALRKIIGRRVLDSLKKRGKKKKFVTFIFHRASFLERTVRTDKLSKYADKWRRIVEELRNKENDGATKIQAFFRGKMARDKSKRIRRLYEILLRLFLRKDKNEEGLMPVAFAKWLKKAMDMKADENARIIQDFCRKGLDNFEKNKKNKNDLAYRKLIGALSKIKGPYNKLAFDKIKSQKSKPEILKFLNYLAKLRLDRLRTAFDNINRYGDIRKLQCLSKLPDIYRKNKLKNALEKWLEKVLRSKKIMTFLIEIITKLSNCSQERLNSALRKWALQAKKMHQKEQADIICDFCKQYLMDYSAINNWHKLANKLRSRKGSSDLDDILRKLRQLVSTKKMIDPLSRHAKKAAFDSLKRNKFIDLFLDKMKKILDDLEGNNEFEKLRKYFDRWRDIVEKMKKREDAMRNLADCIEKRNKINSANLLSNISLLKKLLHDIPIIRAKEAFRKLKDFADNKKKFDELAKNLDDTSKEFCAKMKPELLDRIYKIYYYKILDDLFKRLGNDMKDKMNPLKRKFLNLIKFKKETLPDFEYTNELKGEVDPVNRNTKLNFKLDKDKEKEIGDNGKRSQYAALIPYLIRLIKKLINRRTSSSLSDLLSNSKGEKFCKLLKAHSDKSILPPKEDLVSMLRTRVLGRRLKDESTEKLLRIIRRHFIKTMTETLLEPAHLLRLIYLIKMTLMHKRIKEQRWLRRIIRKWRFTTFVKNMAKKKLEMMYKNMHISYLELAKQFFGEDGNHLNPSIIKEFQRFGDGVGMWGNEDPTLLREAGLCKGFRKRYFFETFDQPYVKKKVITKKEETIEEEYTYGKDKGRYKDTDKDIEDEKEHNDEKSEGTSSRRGRSYGPRIRVKKQQ